MTVVVVPMPVVDWKTVVQADNPARQATVGRLRELRKKKLVAAGVTVSHRQGQRLRGRSTYYSVLTALAARCRREGHSDDAAFLADAASAVEAQFSERLTEFLTHNGLDALAEAPFFDQVTKSTAVVLARWAHLPERLLAAAEVVSVEADTAHLEGTSGRGEPVSVDLPRALLDRQALMAGDLVWISTGLLGTAALVEVLPAMRVPVSAPGGLPTLAAGGSDGLAADERLVLAAQFRARQGADLSQEDLASLRRDAAAGRLPRRRLRPAG